MTIAFGAAKLIPVGGLGLKDGDKQGYAYAHAVVSSGDKSAAILRSTTGGKPGGQLITVQPTYGGYFQSYVVSPVIGLMALGGVLAVMKMRSGSKIKTEPVSIDTPKKSKKSLTSFLSKGKKQGKGLMAGIRGLKGRRRK